MPRKEREQKPPLAEVHFVWLDGWEGRQNLSKVLDAPLGELMLDSFLPANEGARVREARVSVWSATVAAVDRASELYQRRQEASQHKERAKEARKIAAAIDKFLSERGADMPALGVRGTDFFRLDKSQLSGGECPKQQWDTILRSGFDLQAALLNFAEDRDELDTPPGNGADFLGHFFAENIIEAAKSLFPQGLSVSDLSRFALAAWRDMRLPFPEERAARASDEAWMRKKIDACLKLAPETKGAIGN